MLVGQPVQEAVVVTVTVTVDGTQLPEALAELDELDVLVEVDELEAADELTELVLLGEVDELDELVEMAIEELGELDELVELLEVVLDEFDGFVVALMSDASSYRSRYPSPPQYSRLLPLHKRLQFVRDEFTEPVPMVFPQ